MLGFALWLDLPQRVVAYLSGLPGFNLGGTGFFYLEGHGVPSQEVQHLHELAKEFFALPMSEKDTLSASR